VRNAAALLLAAASSLAAAALQRAPAPVTVFEGARLIAGDGSAPIGDSAFVVANGRVAQVGTRTGIRAPSGAVHVDFTGKTVIPALVDAHVHPGYRRALTFTAANYTRANLDDIRDRFTYYGVAAILEAGTGRGDLPFDLQSDTRPGARFLTAGRGFAMPDAGPGVPMRDAAYGVTTDADARAKVRELAAKKSALVKIWVDDRNGTVEKLRPDLYRAIIDEAHAHGLRVMAHIARLDDAKDLLRAGIDGFAHAVRDRDVDAELLAMLHDRPRVFFLVTLWGERNALYDGPPGWIDEPIVRETLTRDQIDELRGAFSTAAASATRNRATADAALLLRNVAALHKAGVPIGLGTDTGGVTGGGYFGIGSHVELELLAKAGFTPAEAIVAGTQQSAAILRLDRLGRVAPGVDADFIVLDANPLDDIRNTRRISRVYSKGVQIDRAALRRRFATDRSSAPR